MCQVSLSVSDKISKKLVESEKISETCFFDGLTCFSVLIFEFFLDKTNLASISWTFGRICVRSALAPL